MTKKAFDEDESQREISRLKKELHFIQMTLYDAKRSKGGLNSMSKENLNTSNMTKSTKPTQHLRNQNETSNPNLDLDDGTNSVPKVGGSHTSYRDNVGVGMGEQSYLSSEMM